MSHFLANVFLRGLSTEGNLRFKIDWASLIVGSKFTVSASRGLHLEGRFNGGFFCVTGLGGLYLEEFIHGGDYFRNFTVLNLTKCMAKRFTEFFL